MIYSKIKQKCLEHSIQLIKNHEWIKLQLILRDSPKQLTEVSDVLEIELLKGETNIGPFLKRKKNKINFSRPITLSLELLSFKPNTLSKKCKEYLCKKLFPHLNEMSDDNNELFVRALGHVIIDIFKDKTTKYPKILKPLINHLPTEIIEIFPIIVKNGWFALGFLYIRKYPPIIEMFEAETKKVFENHNYNYWQFKDMLKILDNKYPNAISIMNGVRNERKSIFYKNLMDMENNNIDFKWFNEYEYYFSVGVDLYTYQELNETVSKLINLEIVNDHSNNNSRWINLCLIQIGWAKRRNVLEKFIEKLIELNYYQVVTDFFKEFPEKISDFKEMLIQDPSFIYSDLYEDLFEEFQFNDPLAIFESWLKVGFNFSHLISIFYKNKPELESQFTKILEGHYYNIDFSNPTENYNSINLNNILFKVTNGYYPKYSIKFIQEKIDELLSNISSYPFFNPYLSKHLFNNFNLLKKETQNKIISVLVQQKKYHVFIRFIQIKYDNFIEYLDRILSMKPENSPETRSYVILLQMIIRKELHNESVFEKLLQRLKKIENVYEKAQLLSYLGYHEEASKDFKDLANKELSLPSLIYTYVDYKLEELEIKGQEFTLYEFSLLNDEVSQILVDFAEYNINKRRNSQFLFKERYYHGRLLFSYGIMLLNYQMYEQAEENLSEASEFLSGLTSTSRIPEEVRTIIIILERIIITIYQLIPVIMQHKDSNFKNINRILKTELRAIVQNADLDDIKRKKISEQIDKLIFDENGHLHQFKGEIPAPFCPKPPIVNRKYCKNERLENIFEWDVKNDPKYYFESVKVSKSWKNFQLVIEFSEKENYYEYLMQIECPNFIKYDIRTSEFDQDKLIFGFFLKSDEFDGKLDIQIKIKPNDRCASEFNLNLPIEHFEGGMKNSQKLSKKERLKEFKFGDHDLGLELKNHLRNLNFYKLVNPELKGANSWLDIINEFFNILHNCYDFKSFYRKLARDWKDEKKDMNPWMGSILHSKFQERQKDHAQVAGGDSDHWVDEIPIEDKLLKSQEKIDNKNLIKEKFNKHKSQVFKEAGKIGFGVCVIADIRKEVIEGNISPFPLKKCFQVFCENNCWIIVFLLQAFQKSPSRK